VNYWCERLRITQRFWLKVDNPEAMITEIYSEKKDAMPQGGMM